jgi:hypothetical protein
MHFTSRLVSISICLKTTWCKTLLCMVSNINCREQLTVQFRMCFQLDCLLMCFALTFSYLYIIKKISHVEILDSSCITERVVLDRTCVHLAKVYLFII